MSSDRDGTTDESVQNTQVTKLQLTPLVRNAHTIAVRGEPLSTYTWLCELDMAKGRLTQNANLKLMYSSLAVVSLVVFLAFASSCSEHTFLLLPALS